MNLIIKSDKIISNENNENNELTMTHELTEGSYCPELTFLLIGLEKNPTYHLKGGHFLRKKSYFLLVYDIYF